MKERGEVVAAVVEGEDVVGAFFEDDGFGGGEGYGVGGGVRWWKEGMVVMVVVVVAVEVEVDREVSDVEGREWRSS